MSAWSDYEYVKQVERKMLEKGERYAKQRGIYKLTYKKQVGRVPQSGESRLAYIFLWLVFFLVVGDTL